ncbi:hypothetical protein [Ramlibacter sp.]|uniref:hypothetical protein n=1 Tax=Ramlibacter sp. TaxID=1917967 RepID=UPI00260CFB2F|nr:hypothetical protein [Ramlibacter sp.]
MEPIVAVTVGRFSGEVEGSCDREVSDKCYVDALHDPLGDNDLMMMMFKSREKLLGDRRCVPVVEATAESIGAPGRDTEICGPVRVLPLMSPRVVRDGFHPNSIRE